MKFCKNRIRKKLVLLFIMVVVTGTFAVGNYFSGNNVNKDIVGMEVGADSGNTEQAGLFSDKGIKLPIIMYHSVIDRNNGTGAYVVSAQTLEQDLEWLENNGYETVLVQEVIDYVKNDGELPKKPVMITFDDGSKNNLEVAFKVMEKHNAKGVYSVVGKYCEGEEAYLNWKEVEEFSKNPLVEIQNHSYNMHELNRRRGSSKMKGEGTSQYVTVFANDTSKMQILLEDKSGVKAVCYTYPFGIISDESIPVVEALGFEASLTCYEKENIITRGDSDCLYLMNRYNRASGESTESYMKRLIGEN